MRMPTYALLQLLRLTWIGVVLKDGDTPVAHIRPVAAKSGELIVVAQLNKEEPLQSIKVGMIQNGNVKLNATEPALIFWSTTFCAQSVKLNT